MASEIKPKAPLLARLWFQIFFGGIILFVATEQTLKITGNPNFFPTVILLGAFVVPLAFTAYVYEYEKTPVRDTPVKLLVICFLVGGAIGLVAAGMLEYQSVQRLGVSGLFAIGLIEEGSKLILPLAIYLRGQNRTEADGLLFGVASGMGFAALETMGYGLVALLQSQGDISVLEEVLLVRGLLSPAGHAAWTGLVCVTIWKERLLGHGLFNRKVFGMFVLAIFLHSMWNIINSIGALSLASFLMVITGNVILAGVSLGLLIRRARQARCFESCETVPSAARTE